MKKKHLFILTAIILLAIYSFTDNDSGKKKISNQLYSFFVPQNWEPYHPGGVTGDGSIPQERDVDVYHLYFLAWRTPVHNDEEFSNSILLNIETYERRDSVSVSIKEVEELVWFRIKETEARGQLNILDIKEFGAKVNQKKFIIKEESEEISVKTGKNRIKHSRIFLLHKHKDRVHCVTIFVNESQYLLPETQVMVKEILDSFSTNSK
jgi:hypothetical protein